MCAGQVRLFPRVFIRKLPGFHFCLLFFLLLGLACGAGNAEKKWSIMVGTVGWRLSMFGDRNGTRRAVFNN